jgi:hypothetical protein
VLINLAVPEEAPGVILDNELLHRAVQLGKPVYQLETVAEQIALFDDMPLETQVALLTDALEGFDFLAGLTSRTLEAWLAGDLAEIRRASTVRMEGEGPVAAHQAYFTRRVIHGRSVIMAHRRQARLRGGNAFFGVGALQSLWRAGGAAPAGEGGISYHSGRLGTNSASHFSEMVPGSGGIRGNCRDWGGEDTQSWGFRAVLCVGG